MNREEIKRILPHREPMLLVDEAYLGEDGKAHGKYTVRGDEFFLQGHFPGNPVSPGVCNIRTIQECACRVAGERLFIATIKRCRLTALVSPAICPKLDVEVRLSPADTGFTVEARMTEAGVTYVEYTGEMRSAVEGR